MKFYSVACLVLAAVPALALPTAQIPPVARAPNSVNDLPTRDLQNNTFMPASLGVVPEVMKPGELGGSDPSLNTTYKVSGPPGNGSTLYNTTGDHWNGNDSDSRHHGPGPELYNSTGSPWNRNCSRHHMHHNGTWDRNGSMHHSPERYNDTDAPWNHTCYRHHNDTKGDTPNPNNPGFPPGAILNSHGPSNDSVFPGSPMLPSSPDGSPPSFSQTPSNGPSHLPNSPNNPASPTPSTPILPRSHDDSPSQPSGLPSMPGGDPCDMHMSHNDHAMFMSDRPPPPGSTPPSDYHGGIPPSPPSHDTPPPSGSSISSPPARRSAPDAQENLLARDNGMPDDIRQYFFGTT